MSVMVVVCCEGLMLRGESESGGCVEATGDCDGCD